MFVGGEESALDMRFDIKEDARTVQVVGEQTFVVDRRLSPCARREKQIAAQHLHSTVTDRS